MNTTSARTAARAADFQSNEIRDLAYLLWRQAGCPAGRDVHFWLQAEQQIVEAAGAMAGAVAAAARPSAPSASAARKTRRSAPAQQRSASAP